MYFPSSYAIHFGTAVVVFCAHFSEYSKHLIPPVLILPECIFVSAKMRYSTSTPFPSVFIFLPSQYPPHYSAATPPATLPCHTSTARTSQNLRHFSIYIYMCGANAVKSRRRAASASAHHVWQELNNLSGLMTDIKQWGMPLYTGAVGEARRSTHLFSSGFMSVALLCICH